MPAHCVRVAPLRVGRRLAPLPQVSDRERCDGLLKVVMLGKDAVVLVPVFPRQRHEIRASVQEL